MYCVRSVESKTFLYIWITNILVIIFKVNNKLINLACSLAEFLRQFDHKIAHNGFMRTLFKLRRILIAQLLHVRNSNPLF